MTRSGVWNRVMDEEQHAAHEAGAHIRRVALSIGPIDLIRFVRYEHDFPRHSHDFLTLAVFATGNGNVDYRGARWNADDGAILVIPPDEAHGAEPVPGGGWTYDALYPSRELLAMALGEHTAGSDTRNANAFFARPIFHDAALARDIAALHRKLSRDPVSLFAEEWLLAVLRRLVDRHSTAVPARTAAGRASQMVRTACEYLRSHFAEPVTLAELAAECAVSPFHLIRQFRSATGLPPHAYLTQVRTQKARELLLAGASASAVAHQCGFADQSHFTRTFKRIFGFTPAAYQRESSL
ncbi:MAG TPA: AraC family transcriptional regulator [Gemmatimonadaceae bacterium]|nr:AraC family transcriptional regulator [Gemmatimonadaceae bacterium]